VAAAERISEVAQLVVDDPAEQKLVVVSAMGSHPSSPVKVTDLLLNMVAKASKQDQAFLIDLAALQVSCSVTCWDCSQSAHSSFFIMCLIYQFQLF
jgi:aspartokinase